MEKSIKPGDWVRSIEKSNYAVNERLCPLGTIKQVRSVDYSGNLIFDRVNNSCLARRFEIVNKPYAFNNLYEKLSN